MLLLPYTIYDTERLAATLKWLEDSVNNEENKFPTVEEARSGITGAMEEALGLVESVPPEFVGRLMVQFPQLSYTPNTVFVIMSMDPENPELEDVFATIERACRAFGLSAVRADKIEHQGMITEEVLNRIASSEILIADLTGERPNVYYEVGYAHALKKRPILVRKQGTKLHFDLSNYNTREYPNLHRLEDLLKKCVEEILGRKPSHESL